MDDTQYQLIAEQLGRMKDNIESRFKRVEGMIEYSCTLEKERLDGIRGEIIEIKEITKDHETRLRTATDNITALKTNRQYRPGLADNPTLDLSAHRRLAGVPMITAEWANSRMPW